MATPIYFPNPIATLPEPRFVEPQSNTAAIALGAGLKSITDVANNFRTKEMNVAKANQMAEALEREGLTQEANLYRSAAQSYQTNFFATPEENERFNQSLLNDTLKLLTNKQEREMKAQQLQAEAEYKNALIDNMNVDNLFKKRELEAREDEIGLRRQERQDAMSQTEANKQVASLEAAARSLEQQKDKNLRAYEAIKAQRADEQISAEEYPKAADIFVNNYNKAAKEVDNIRSQINAIRGISLPDDTGTELLNITPVATKSELYKRDADEADRIGKQYPNLKEIPVNGKTYTNKFYVQPASVSRTQGINAEGQPFSSETVRGPSLQQKQLPKGLPIFTSPSSFE